MAGSTARPMRVRRDSKKNIFESVRENVRSVRIFKVSGWGISNMDDCLDLVLEIAGKYWWVGPDQWEDIVAAGMLGLAIATARCEPGRKLGPYAEKYIRGEILKCIDDWHSRGGMGRDARVERWVRRNASRWPFRPSKDKKLREKWPYKHDGSQLTAPDVVEVLYHLDSQEDDKNKHYNCTLPTAQAALQGYAPCQYHISEFIDDDDEDDESNGVFVDDNQELLEFDGSGGKVSDEAWRKIVAGRSRPSGRLGIRRGRWATFTPEPLKTINRERYEEDQAQAYRFDTAAFVQHRLSQRLVRIARAYGIPRQCIGIDENQRRNRGRPSQRSNFEIPRGEGRVTPVPLREYLEKNPTPKGRKIDAPIRGTDPPLGVIEYMAAAADLRAMRRVAQVGRQKYAEELVEKDRARRGGRIEYIVHGGMGLGFDEVDSRRQVTADSAITTPKNLLPTNNFSSLRRSGPHKRAQTRTQKDHASNNSRYRMSTVRTAVGENHAKFNNILQPGSVVHRANRGDG